MTSIYSITSPNGAIYIGQSRKTHLRFSKYKKLHCKKQIKIHRSLVKYGADNHIFKILHLLPLDVSDFIINEYESFYIQQYLDCGFDMLNMKPGGSFVPLTNEAKNKISIANKGRKRSVESIMRRQNTRGPYIFTQEMRTKISAAGMGRKPSAETINKISIANKGRICRKSNYSHSIETKNKIMEGVKKNWLKRKGLL